MIKGSDKLEIIIKETITPLFKSNSFKKQGRNYYKPFEDFGLTFNVQTSQHNWDNHVSFTANLGIFIPSAFKLNREGNAEIPKFPKTYECFNPIRIGQLISDCDTWYLITESTNMDEINSKIMKDIEEFVMPYFNRYKNIDDVINLAIESLNGTSKIFNEIQLSTILISLGKRTQGEELFKEFYNRLKSNNDKSDYIDFLNDKARKLQISV